MKTTLASMLLLLGLVALATVPTVATTADQCPAAVQAPQSGAPGQADPPGQAPDQGEGLDSDLFNPERVPMCQTGMCSGDGQCKPGLVCYREPGWSCGYCVRPPDLPD